MKAAAEARWHPSDEESRVGPGAAVDRGGQGGGGGLAVSARHHQRPPVLEEEARQRLRHGDLVEAAVDGGGGDRVVARDGVTHHHQIRRRIEVGRVVAHQRLDARCRQQVAHGRIERRVAAAHPVAEILEQTGQRRHAGAADGDEEDIEGPVGHGCSEV